MLQVRRLSWLFRLLLLILSPLQQTQLTVLNYFWVSLTLCASFFSKWWIFLYKWSNFWFFSLFIASSASSNICWAFAVSSLHLRWSTTVPLVICLAFSTLSCFCNAFIFVLWLNDRQKKITKRLWAFCEPVVAACWQRFAMYALCFQQQQIALCPRMKIWFVAEKTLFLR